MARSTTLQSTHLLAEGGFPPHSPGTATGSSPAGDIDGSLALPVVRRIDHLIIRVDDSRYDELYSFFADILRLPTPWPPAEHPTMRSGGIFAGNVDFEILYVPADHITDHAELYGLVFEAWAENAAGLAQRGFAYLPAEYTQKEAGKPPTLLWMNYFLESFWQHNFWQRFIFGLRKLIPDSLWLRSARDSSGNAKSVQWIFNQVYRQGIVFLVQYNPAWRDIDAERRISKAQLEIRAGGLLGLIRVKEVAFGTTQLTESSARWRKLLRPAIEETGLCWQVGDGPALRVITAERDALHHMVWEVASLADAQAALASLGLLGAVMPDEITLDPSKCFGLDIRLIEPPGGFTGEG
jgi:hypothetical protein